MKKDYSKPEVLFESFELSQSIAAGCEYISNHVYGACPVMDPAIGATVFALTGVCTITTPTGNDRICYNVPAENNRVFSS